MEGQRLLFLGSKGAGLIALQRLLERLPAGRVQAILCPDDLTDSRSVYTAFERLAALHQVPLHMVTSTAQAIEWIQQYRPDTAVVHGWYRLIPVAQFPSLRFLGFHFSPLPTYRGNAPLVWQILNGEQQLGVSFFRLSEGMDDGELVDQRLFELGINEDVSSALDKANQLVMSMLDDFIPRWQAGDVSLKPQPDMTPSYCGLRQPEDGQIDWRADAEIVHNFIRAQTRPYPGAFSRLKDGRVVRFWRSEMEARTFFGVPGAVVDVAPDCVTVACGSGAIKIRELEIDGGGDVAAGPVRSLKTRFT